MTDKMSIAYARYLDKHDKLAGVRGHFHLPDTIIYLDGNSLGPLPNSVPERLHKTIMNEWASGLIRSWNKASWIDLPQIAGKKLAPLLGVDDDLVIVTDSTSINLFKAISAALSLNPKRKIISQKGNFPTDNYIAEGVIKQTGGSHELVLVEGQDDILNALDDKTALVMLTHINFRDGVMLDMQEITKKAHDAGALILWDLAHSAGVVPLDLQAAGADFAVGCGYKYLNGGPGAPAFIYVARQHLGQFTQPLSGWFAHKAPFDFTPDYQAASDVKQYLCGTPPILSLVALDEALSLWQDIQIDDVRQKSIQLCDHFIELVEAHCGGHGLRLISPKEGQLRGSQISYAHDEAGYAIMAALIDRGVIGDFRAPNILRFGFAPLYIRFEDVWQAVQHLSDILENRTWDQPHYHKRKAVT